jgi:NAD-dependent dihydropyrimidine dehydrogenase PreA subunit
MLRQIVTQEPSQCTMCGACLEVCPNEALAVRDDAVRLVNEALCQGDGLCVKACSGPLALEWREAAPYDEAAVTRRRQKLERLRALGAEV